MQIVRMQVVAAALLLTATLCACGGGASAGGGGDTQSAPQLNPPILSTQALTFNGGSQTAIGTSSQTFSVSEAGYGGGFSENDTCAPANAPVIASVNPASNTSFVVAPESAGACTITVSDDFGQNASLNVTVTTTALGIQGRTHR